MTDPNTCVIDMMEVRYGSSRKSTVLHLVPEFAGDGDVSEWLDKLETTCTLNDVTSDQDILYVITLRLTGEAYRVVQQLDAKVRAVKGEVIAALLAAYECNMHDAYEQFRVRRWKEGESVDGYLAALRKLAKSCGGASDKMIVAAFISGLPDRVKSVMRASVGADCLDVSAALTQARQIIRQLNLNDADKCLAVAGERMPAISGCDRPRPNWNNANQNSAGVERRRERPRPNQNNANQNSAGVEGWRERPKPGPGECWKCGKRGHQRWECRQRGPCFNCGMKGHEAWMCPGNGHSE